MNNKLYFFESVVCILGIIMCITFLVAFLGYSMIGTMHALSNNNVCKELGFGDDAKW